MLIAQISDLHVTTRDNPTSRFVDPNAAARQAVGALNRLSARPDVVIATGDLTDDGTVEQYRVLRAILAELELPLYLLPGNHDDASVLAGELGGDIGHLPDDVDAAGGAHLSYVVEDHPVRVVMLDTTDPHRHDGVFPPERARWLADTLDAAPRRPTLVAMHHPPFDTGIWWMDVVGLEGRDRFEEVIRARRQVRQVVCGHVHRSTFTAWGETVVSICPSTAHQVRLDLDPHAPPAMTREQPSYQLHQWNGERFVSNTAVVAVPEATLDLTQYMSSWPEARARMAAGGPFPKGGMLG